MKVAIIGSGASAYGVLSAIEEEKNPEIQVTLFEVAKTSIDEHRNFNYNDNSILKIYKIMKRNTKPSYLPTKYYYDDSRDLYKVDGNDSIQKSNFLGGLTNFWGGGMYPYLKQDLINFGWDENTFYKYYALIASKIGISGDSNDFKNFLSINYANNPPIRNITIMDKLKKNLIKNKNISIGKTHIAIDKNIYDEFGYQYNSEEIWLGSKFIWNAARNIIDYKDSKLITMQIYEKVEKIQDKYIFTSNNEEESEGIYGPFDKIYVAAGCIGSSEIIMRSTGLEKLTMEDNLTLSFPLIFLGRISNKKTLDDINKYFSLSNLTIFKRNEEEQKDLFMFSVYPFSDHFLRFFVPFFLWKVLKKITNYLRKRIVIVRVCMPYDCNLEYNLYLKNEKLIINKLPEKSKLIKSRISNIKKIFKKSGFKAIPFLMFKSRISHHFGSTLSKIKFNGIDYADGKTMKSVHVVDSSTFPFMPSISPTYTIITNAFKITKETIND